MISPIVLQQSPQSLHLNTVGELPDRVLFRQGINMVIHACSSVGNGEASTKGK